MQKHLLSTVLAASLAFSTAFLAISQAALGDNSCENVAADARAAGAIGLPPGFSQTRLDQIASQSYILPWTGRVLRYLLGPIAERNASALVSFEKPSTILGKIFDLSFSTLTIPFNLSFDLIEIARAKGLSPGQRYIVFPFRMLLASVHANIFAIGLYVASLGYSGEVLAHVGLAVPSPLSTKADPTDLPKGRDVVIVKLFQATTKPRSDGNTANIKATDLVTQIQQDFPDRVHVLDLAAVGSTARGDLKDATAAFARKYFADKSRQATRVIIVSHGTPGAVALEYDAKNERSMDVGLGDLADILRPLASHTGEETDVYFDGCSVAATCVTSQGTTINGKAEVAAFGSAFLPHGGRVHANNVSGVDWRASRMTQAMYYGAGPAKTELFVGFMQSVNSASDGYSNGPFFGEPIEHVVTIPAGTRR